MIANIQGAEVEFEGYSEPYQAYGLVQPEIPAFFEIEKFRILSDPTGYFEDMPKREVYDELSEFVNDEKNFENIC